MATTEKIPANYSKFDNAFRSIGYSFESAVADVIDNAIDAEAPHIRIRLVQREDGAFDLAIIDDGKGMSAEKLKEALRYGSDVVQDMKRLGKFGFGLKLASLSQAKDLRVFTKARGKLSGRAYLEDGIQQEFLSTVYDDGEIREFVRKIVPDHPFRKQGTIVYWTHLYRIGHHDGDSDAQAQRLVERLQNHLRLSFHRLLGGKKPAARMSIDVFRPDRGEAGIPCHVTALDPFGYRQSGCAGYPKKFSAEAGGETFPMTAHIWPPNADQTEYRLPGGANSRQGFYFYRNERLIHAGGWNGIREIDPHLSLARIAIDLDPGADLKMSLDVKKSEIHLPPALAKAIKDAKAKDGTTWSDYISNANDSYRTRSLTTKELPLVPGSGVPMEMREILFEVLRLPQTTKHRKINFEWAKLDPHLVFWAERSEDTIILNSRYRKSLLHGLDGSGTDLPALKCLLFLLCQDVFRAGRIGGRLRQKLQLANLMLHQAVKHERTGE